MTQNLVTRRTVLASSTLLTAGFGLASGPSVAQTAPVSGDSDLVAYKPNESDFPYEVTRTEAEWQEHLGHDELTYGVLRLAKTEKPKSTDLWIVPHDAGYLCRGSVMFGYDAPVPEYGQAGMGLDESNVLTEVHCRRCGSHVGHHLLVQGMYLHCINGTALKLV